MNVFKRLLLSFCVVVLSVLVCAPGVQAGSKIPLKGLFKVLRTDDIGFGHSLLHSGVIENMYQFAPGKAKSKDDWSGKSEGDFVADLVRVLWFRVQDDFQLNPTQRGVTLGLDGEIFGQLMNHIYSGTIYSDEIIKEKRNSKGKILEKGFINHWYDRGVVIAKGNKKYTKLNRIKGLVDLIVKSLDFCEKEKRYKARIVQGVLWAFFFHKLKDKNLDGKIREINASLSQIDEKYKDKSKALRECYSYKELKDFEENIKKLNKESQLILMSKEYDLTLHYLLNKKGKYPSVVSQGRYSYEYQKGKFSDSRPNCYEVALLDMFSILWHNPEKGCYDNSLLPGKRLDGKGFKRLRQALKSLSVAENNKIRSEQYSCDIGGKKYSSLVKLCDIISEKNLEDQVDKLKIKDINTSYINRVETDQEWFNVISGIDGVQYCSEVEGKKIFEVNPGVKNFIKIFNYFYGTDAKSVDELGELISTEKRTITFKKTKKEDTPNEIEISVEDEVNYFYFNMTVIIMTWHVGLRVPGREGSKSKIIKEGVPEALLKAIDSKNSKNNNILMFLANKDLLKEKIKWDASMLNQVYYSLLLKDENIKLDAVKDILSRPIGVYNQLKYLVYNLIDTLPNDEHFDCVVFYSLIASGKLKSDDKLRCLLEEKKYEKKYVGKVIIMAVRRGNKEVVGLLLAHKDMDVNRFRVLPKALYEGDKEIIKLLLAHKDIDVNKGGPLPQAVYKGGKEIVRLLLAHKKIDVNKGEPLYHAANKGNKEIVELLLAHKDIDVNKGIFNRTPLFIAVDKGYKEIVELLLAHKDIDVNNGELFIALAGGYKEIAKLLIERKDIDVNEGGCSALRVALDKGYKEIVRLLLAREDTDVNEGGIIRL